MNDIVLIHLGFGYSSNIISGRVQRKGGRDSRSSRLMDVWFLSTQPTIAAHNSYSSLQDRGLLEMGGSKARGFDR